MGKASLGVATPGNLTSIKNTSLEQGVVQSLLPAQWASAVHGEQPFSNDFASMRVVSTTTAQGDAQRPIPMCTLNASQAEQEA
jgi:hypothetical protein